MASNGAGKMLVVDDTPENLRLLVAVLVPQGYEVLTATSGDEALDLVSATRPDLILLDVVMPAMDGYAVCQALRADEETAVLPVIMVTAPESVPRKREQSRPARTTSSPSPSTTPSCSPVLARCFASSATTTRSRPRLPSFAS